MDFKFKEGESKKPKDGVVENEAADSETNVNEMDHSQFLAPGPTEDQFSAKEMEQTETAVPDVSMSDGGKGEKAPPPPAPPIPDRFEIYDDPPPLLSFKRIFFMALLLGGGYFGYSYYTTGKIPYFEKQSVVDPEPVEAAVDTTDVEELTDLLRESRELLKSTRERKRREASRVEVSPPDGRENLSKLEIIKFYRGRWAILSMKDGSVREGRVIDIKNEVMLFNQRFPSGSISVPIPIQDIVGISQ